MPADKTEESTGVVLGEHYRFSVLTSQLIRMEYAPDGVFEDRPTQIAQCRAFALPDYRVWRMEDGRIEIHTDHVSVFYDGQPFSPNGLWAENRSECRGIYCTWHFGDALSENLGGTARTLDEADGPVPLEYGIQSRLQGFAVLDDSHSFVLTEDGWFAPRAQGAQDIYFFSYGYDYRQALKDYFHLCGPTPLLPRYALGNWWSRFHAYTDTEYLALMDRFAAEGVPLSVAVIDMDWHITQPAGRGKGWTGYTWNRTLFPDPSAFLRNLHGRGLKTTLNLHPAEGVQAHEEAYPAMARAMGRDAERSQRIPFMPGDRAFMRAYFELLHHPREVEGVDFWWVDWQQGTTTTAEGLDPLWALNHLHMADSVRNGMRGLILSRYAGPGSHRYPIGFSGDSVISWASLQFQPYFTATAANIGYAWWSHDIGGHAHGRRDDELQVRWLQLGVFSPILRLHSTNNPFGGKETLALRRRSARHHGSSPAAATPADSLPLQHEPPLPHAGRTACATDVLRLPARGGCLPRAQSVSVWHGADGGADYAAHGRGGDAGQRNGMVAGRGLFDFLNGLRLEGGRRVILSRPLSQIPVLAKAGRDHPYSGGGGKSSQRRESAGNAGGLGIWRRGRRF